MGIISSGKPDSFEDYVEKIRKATSKESADKLDHILNSLDKLTDLVERKEIRTEAILAHVLERDNITQDRFDELMNLLKSFGKQKGFKV